MTTDLYEHQEGIYLKLDYKRVDVLMRIFIATAILIGAFSPIKSCYAQNEFRHYSSDEGFTGSGYKTIVQDSLGFLWISSSTFIFKFDGFTFTPYKASVSQGNLAVNENRLWVDGNGQPWMGLSNSISYFDRNLEKFVPYALPIDGVVPETLCSDVKSNLWLGARKGLIHLDPSTQQLTIYRNNKGNTRRLNERNSIRTIVNEDLNLLMGTDEGLWKFNKETKEFLRPLASPTDTALIYSGIVRKIITADDKYWIWMDDQLVQLNERWSAIRTLRFQTIHEKFDSEKKFESVEVVSVARDNGGIFWIALQGLGLVRYDPSTGELINYRHDPNVSQSLPSDVLHHVMVDRDQNVWVATVNKGIAQLKRRTIAFHNYLPGVSTTGIALVKGTRSTHLVTGSNGHGLWTTSIDSRGPADLRFEKLDLGNIKGFESSIELSMGRERLWVGSLNSGVVGLRADKQSGRIDPTSALLLQRDDNNVNTISENFITSVMEDQRGHLWVGSYNHGMNEIDLALEYRTPGSVYQYHLTESDSVFEDITPDIIVDGDQTVLTATSRGLYIIHPATRQAERVSEKIHCNKMLRASDGTLYAGTKAGLMEGVKSASGFYTFKLAPLPGSPWVTFIQEDRLGRIWCSSLEGLFFYDKRNQFVRVFKKEDGLPSSRTVSAAGGIVTPAGLMILSNAEGITAFNPESLRLSTVAPKPMFTQLKINNQIVNSADVNTDDVPHESINTLKELTLNHKQIILTIEFSAMDFSAPEKNEYRYKLENFDNDWVHADWKNRTATYTNLKPGNYTFVVVASNTDGVWGTIEKTLTISVSPPPWKTWWAYSIYGIVIASILFIVRRNIIKQERLASKLALEHVELEKVQEIDKAKTNFFANISHEFRTPLTLIQGPVQNLLEKFKTDAEVKGQLNLVQQNSDRLLRLVNQILELARLESGMLKNETSESNIILFLKQIVGSFTSFAIQKRISFILQFPEYGVLAKFDKDKLEKITSNLISNALKFTPEQGAVIVNVSVTTSNGAGELKLRVTDTGKGIPDDQMSKVFERFYQVSEDGNINVGSGIGLALCKELAEFLGGSLILESKVGEGSRFTLQVPLEKAERIIETKTEEPLPVHVENVEVSFNGKNQQEEQLEKPMILIVEDHV